MRRLPLFLLSLPLCAAMPAFAQESAKPDKKRRDHRRHRPSEYVTATQTNVHHIPSQELASVHAMGTLPLVPVMVHAQSRIVRLER